MMITYERLKPDLRVADYERVVQLLNELRPTFREPTFDQVVATAAANIVVVARDTVGDIVGMATLVFYRQFAETIAEIEDVVVLSGHHRYGIGKGLMQFIEIAASSNGADLIHLVTDERRTAAIAFYEKCGYKKREKITFQKIV